MKAASRVAVAKLRLDGTPTPRSWVARMTKRLASPDVGKSASAAEAVEGKRHGSFSGFRSRRPSRSPAGDLMTGYAWGLACSTGCDIYRPGHQVHWVQFNRSMRDPGPVIPVAAMVDDDRLVHVEGEGVGLVCWHHRPELVRAALERFDGRADWKPRWKLLAVPMESAVGGPSTVFYLAVPGTTHGECRTTQQAIGSSGTASPSGPSES